MTIFDLLAISTILVSLIVSTYRGLIQELVSLLGWIIALIFARFFATLAADVFLSTLKPHELAVVVGFVLCFIVCRIILTIAAHLLDFALEKINLTSMNRLLGASIGLIKGVAAVTLIVLVCSFSKLPKTDAWQNAKTAPVFEQLASFGLPYLPEFLQKQSTFANSGSLKTDLSE